MSSVAVGILSGVLMGMVFGFALEKSRVFEPGMIVGQMQLRNWIMLKVFLSAVATGAVVLAFLNGFGFVKLQPKAALYAADIVGGLILGAGIALAGACPGTTLAQIGVGYRDAIFTLLGGLVGAVAFSYAQPWLARSLIGTGPKQIFTESGGHSLLARRAGARRGHRHRPHRDREAAAVARGSWRGCRWQRFGKGIAAAQPSGARRIDGCLPEHPIGPWLTREARSAIAASRGAGADKGRGRVPAFVIHWTVGTKEIRPVSILETGAGLPEPAFPTIASFAVRSETLFKRLGRGSQGGTHDKRAGEQCDSHCALHVD